MTANVALTDTFDQWRVKTNEIIVMTQADGMNNIIKTLDTTNSTSNTTGSIITAGGVGVSKSVVIGENLRVHGNVIVDGDTTISGNLVFGDADADQVTFTADINSSFIPNANVSFDLGNTTMLWANTFTGHATITQKADSGKPAITLTGLDVDQIAVDVNASQTTGDVVDITADAVTTGKVIDITADSLTTGSGIYIDSDSSTTDTRSLATIIQNHASATGATAMTLQADAGRGLFIDTNLAAGGYSLEIDSEQTTTNVAKIAAVGTSGTTVEVSHAGVMTGKVVDITADAATTGTGINMSMDGLTTGSMMALTSDSSSTATRSLVTIKNDNASATAAVPLEVTQDSTNAVAKFSGTTTVVLPVGTTSNRGHAIQGGVRYNTTTSAFEGYSGSSWGSLGGVIDVDQDTKILAETSAGADNDDLEFYTAGTKRMMIDETGAITVGVAGTGYDVTFFGDTSGKHLLWDQSGDELLFATSTKLSFHDAGGGENILASADGHLEINAGTTLDITAPTVDINAATSFNIDGTTLFNNTVTVGVDDTGYDVKFFGATSGSYMLWDESTDDLILGGAAQIGIGTTAPETALHVVGTGGGVVSAIMVEDSNATSNQRRFRMYSSSQKAYFDIPNDAFNSATDVMAVDLSNGYVGIGTTAPNKLLEVSAAVPTFRFNSTETNVGSTDILGEISWKSADGGRGGDPAAALRAISSIADGTHTDMVFLTGEDGSAASEKMRIASTGYVGIGQANPTNALHISAADTSSVYTSYTNSTTGHLSSDGFYIGINGGGTAAVNLWNIENTDIRFATNNTQRMTITAAGNVGLGTTAPVTSWGSGKKVLALKGDSGDNYSVLELYNHGTDANNDYLGIIDFGDGSNQNASIRVARESATNDAYMTFFTNNQGSIAEKLRITASGLVGIGTSTPQYGLEVAGAAGSEISFLRNDTSIAANDMLGTLHFSGNDPSHRVGAQIKVNAHDDWASNDCPTYMTFLTTDDGTAGIDERMRITHNGYVGIGSITPRGKLDIGNGSLFFDNNYGVRWGADKSGIYGNGETSGGFIRFVTDDVERMRIVENGSIGIGTDNPNGLNASGPCLDLEGAEPQITFLKTGQSQMAIGVNGNIDSGSAMMFYTGGSNTRLCILSDGKIGIGETSPLGNKVHIKVADSGLGSVSSHADTLVLEDDDDAGLTIMSGTSHYGGISFGDAGNESAGMVRYYHGGDKMDIITGGSIELQISSARHLHGTGATNAGSFFQVMDGEQHNRYTIANNRTYITGHSSTFSGGSSYNVIRHGGTYTWSYHLVSVLQNHGSNSGSNWRLGTSGYGDNWGARESGSQSCYTGNSGNFGRVYFRGGGGGWQSGMWTGHGEGGSTATNHQIGYLA